MPRIPLNMPKMSMTMEFGTLVEWMIDVGGQVRNGDAIAVVTTDKVDMEVEATMDGVLAEILAQPGDELPVGQPMGFIESEVDDLLGDLFGGAPAAPAQPAGGAPSELSAAPARPVAEVTDGDRPRAVPLARRLAAEAGLDLHTVTASGPTGTIRARDVREAIASRAQVSVPTPAATPAPATTSAAVAVPLITAAATELLGDARTRRTRIATAKVMAATAVIPQFTVFRVLDLSRLAKARTASLKGVSWTTILVRAYAITLREYPQLNGYWAEQGVKANPQVGVSLAIDTDYGLLAPVILDPDKLAIRELDRTVRGLAEQVKQGQVDPNLMAGGTGTVSNLGGMGVDRFNALLTPPQATALSLGSVTTRPVFDASGEVIPQTCCEVGLTVDHRAADGADGARALATMQACLADPFLLLG